MLLKKTSGCLNVECGEESNPGRSLCSSVYLFSLYYELDSSVCFKLLCSVLFFTWFSFDAVSYVKPDDPPLFSHVFSFISLLVERQLCSHRYLFFVHILI